MLSADKQTQLGSSLGVELRRLRDGLVTGGDETARLLVDELQRLRTEEEKYLQNQDDVSGGLEFAMDRQLTGENPFLKAQAANILADMYATLTPTMQNKALKEMAIVYTPSVRDDTYTGLLNHAFMRIGKSTVPVLIEMLGTKSEFLRCNAAQLLSSWIGEAGGAPEIPRVRCNETDALPESAQAQWRSWWEANGAKVEVPQPQSMFEVVY